MGRGMFRGARMSWGGWSEFWSLDGGGLYVWAAYLVAVAVVIAEVLVLTMSRHSIEEHLGRYADSTPDPATPKPSAGEQASSPHRAC